MQTVTMLFTDIEGSTRLLDRLGLAYTDVLTRQRELLRAVFDKRHGPEIGTEGDSFFVVFDSATDAVEAASVEQWQANVERGAAYDVQEALRDALRP